MTKKYIFIIVSLALILSLCLWLLQSLTQVHNWLLLHTINLSLAVLSLVSLRLHQKALSTPSHIDFMNKTLGVMGLRMLVVLGIIISFVVLLKTHIGFKSILGVMFFYFVYNMTELYYVQKMLPKLKKKA